MPPTPASPFRHLLRWRPMQALWGLALIALAIPAGRMIIDAAHFSPGGLNIETQGASGTLRNGRLSLDLPVDVYNGSDRVVMDLTLWVRAYACPRETSPLSACKRVFSALQAVPMRLMPGGSLHTSQTLSAGVPADLPGDAIRILRQIDSMRDDRDEMDDVREARMMRANP